MSEEEQLKLQCYLDGELTEKDRRDLALWLDENEEARTALDVLQTVRETIRENEPAYKLDCTHEFYWNGIERRLNADDSPVSRPRGGSLLDWLRFHMAQLAGAAAGVALVVFSFIALTGEPEVQGAWEVLDPNMAMVNYNDFDNNITVVMLYDQSTAGFTPGN